MRDWVRVRVRVSVRVWFRFRVRVSVRVRFKVRVRVRVRFLVRVRVSVRVRGKVRVWVGVKVEVHTLTFFFELNKPRRNPVSFLAPASGRDSNDGNASVPWVLMWSP